MNLWDLKKYRNSLAVITEQGDRYYYHDLDRMQKKFASYIQPQSLICIVAVNDLGSLIAYMACLLNHSVPILLSGDEREDSTGNILEKYQPDYVWLSIGLYKKYMSGLREYERVFSYLGYELITRKEKVIKNMNPDLALLLPTSGSTGSPRLVRISYTNILENTKSICQYMELTAADRAVTSLPMSYTYGLSVINTLFYTGGSIFLTTKSVVNPVFWRHMEEYGVTILSGVPYTYECMRKMNVPAKGLAKLRLMTQAGGKLSEELQKYWGESALKKGAEFLIMYGQTEATARISWLPHSDCLRKLGSAGIAIPGCEIMLEDTEGRFIQKSYLEGEVVCRGRQVSMGYAEKLSDLGLGDLNHGILHTGDRGYFDEEGYLYITGRMSRFAKIYGRRIDLVCVEKVAGEIWGEDVIVLSDDRKVLLYMGSVPQEDDIVLLGYKTGLGKEVIEICRREDIPRKSNGKVDYSK